MESSEKYKSILNQLNSENSKLGDLKKWAKQIKIDHNLALELWRTKKVQHRMLALLILDKNKLSQELIDRLDNDMQIHSSAERTRMMEWLMANQLMKHKKGLALIESWQHSPSCLQKRTFYYHQARLRWTGQTPPDNTDALLTVIESTIHKEHPDVQWAMNFLCGWVGVFDEKQRKRCIELGENTALFKEERAVKGCTPNYLPEFINIELAKRNVN